MQSITFDDIELNMLNNNSISLWNYSRIFLQFFKYILYPFYYYLPSIVVKFYGFLHTILLIFNPVFLIGMSVLRWEMTRMIKIKIGIE